MLLFFLKIMSFIHVQATMPDQKAWAIIVCTFMCSELKIKSKRINF